MSFPEEAKCIEPQSLCSCYSPCLECPFHRTGMANSRSPFSAQCLLFCKLARPPQADSDKPRSELPQAPHISTAALPTVPDSPMPVCSVPTRFRSLGGPDFLVINQCSWVPVSEEWVGGWVSENALDHGEAMGPLQPSSVLLKYQHKGSPTPQWSKGVSGIGDGKKRSSSPSPSL